MTNNLYFSSPPTAAAFDCLFPTKFDKEWSIYKFSFQYPILEQKSQLMGCDGCGERFCLMGLTHSSLPPSLPPGNQRCWLMSSFCRAVSSQCISTNFTLAGENYRSGFPTKLNVLCAWDWISEPLLFFCLAESRQFLSFSAFQDSFVEQLRRWTRSFIASFALMLVQIQDTHNDTHRYPHWVPPQCQEVRIFKTN